MSKRIGAALLLVVCVAAGVTAVGSWARPWRFAAGNPDVPRDKARMASAQVVAGCSAGDSRNEINCVQYVDFDADNTQVRHAAVHITDGFRHGREDPGAVLVVYDARNPHRFRLADGNPGTSTRVLGTVWVSFVTVAGGGTAGGFLAGLVATARAPRGRRTSSRHDE